MKVRELGPKGLQSSGPYMVNFSDCTRRELEHFLCVGWRPIIEWTNREVAIGREAGLWNLEKLKVEVEEWPDGKDFKERCVVAHDGNVYSPFAIFCESQGRNHLVEFRINQRYYKEFINQIVVPYVFGRKLEEIVKSFQPPS